MGPLKGIRVIEMAGIGPGPFAGMLLADLGAEVIRIDRSKAGMTTNGGPVDVMNRGKKSISVDLKNPAGVEVVLKLIETADALIEGYRPGVMEKLGLGPDVCIARNKRLVFGRMTGWGQTGPLAHTAGHDINYIAITGALDSIGTKESGPVVPLNLLGDFGGGSMYLIMGLLAGIIEAKNSGKGQAIDVAITDGVISLMSFMHGFKAMGMWESGRNINMLDGTAHYYDTYQCSDGEWISIGSIEPQFYALLEEKLGVDLQSSDFMVQYDKTRWPELKEQVKQVILAKPSDYWCELMEGTDVCFAPVLSLQDSPEYPHNKQRQSYVEIEGVTQSAPAPRFSRTVSEIGNVAVVNGANTDEILASLGLDEAAIAKLNETGAVKCAE
jgi:alpha-methylacyl-CoA racemase|tara:strand:+ start:1317 stop:2468 length:1152 start_codon:yes stop_codon:yes gene_type:complete